MTPLIRLIGCSCTLLLTLLVTDLCSANDKAVAEQLYREGRELAEQEKWEAAATKFAESHRLDPSAGATLNLANCYEKLGKTASAWAQYLDAAGFARSEGRADRETLANEKAAALEGQLGYLTLVVQEPIEGLRIQRDGVVLAQAAWSTKTPIDPGAHVIEADAPGYEPFRERLNIPRGTGSHSVIIPKLNAAAPAPASAPAPEPATEQESVEGPPAPISNLPAEKKSNTLAWVVGGAGVAVLLAGVTVGYVGNLKYKDAKDLCDGRTTNCPSDAVSKGDSAGSLFLMGDVLGGVGIVGIGVGVGLLIFGGSDDTARTEQATLPISVVLGRNEAGAQWQGKF